MNWKQLQLIKDQTIGVLNKHHGLKNGIIKSLMGIGSLTSPLRVYPDFIIAGVQKAGTTSLYHYLKEHPCIFLPLKQEVHYYDFMYQKGLLYYRSHFPTEFFKHLILKLRGCFKTGECTPYYFVHPRVPQRIALENPEVKILVLFRDPIERTYSHYQHEFQKKREKLCFKEALECEEKRLKNEKTKLTNSENYYSYNHHRYSYLERSRYADQVRVWEKYFDRKQFLFISSEKLFSDPQCVMDKCYDFLEVHRYRLRNPKIYNARQYSPMDENVKDILIRYFRPLNEKLYELTGKNYGWEKNYR